MSVERTDDGSASIGDVYEDDRRSEGDETKTAVGDLYEGRVGTEKEKWELEVGCWGGGTESVGTFTKWL